MKNREKIIARLAKIKALAKDGVGGERDAAAKLLEAVATKYGIDLDRIEEGKERLFPIEFKRGWRLDLIVQLFGIMRLEQYGDLKADHCRVCKHTYKDGSFQNYAACTEAQWCEMEAKFAVLAIDYEAQHKAFFRAFLMANDLLVPCDPGSQPPTKQETKEDVIASWMSAGIRRSNLRKQIGIGDQHGDANDNA